ncbi:MAG: response regulator [Bacilli bacterium]|nr:response regulator [Bacilli bacterium]
MIKDKNILIQNGVDLNKSLELFGDMTMYDESLGDFMAEVENKLYKIAHFKDAIDMPNYAILVHSLKSDAKYFGFTKLAEIAYEHELKSKEKNIIFVNDNYNILMDEANRIVELVKKYLSSGNNTVLPLIKNEDTNKVVSIDSNKKTILAADDSEIIINFIKKIFANEYNLLFASDGEEAINYINQNSNYKIVAFLLDLNMPKVDGFKVLEFMKENNLFKDIPVSIVTGNDSREINLNAFEYPIVDILKKPFTPEAVKNIVERTINFKQRY